jgi:hypothetical protein
MFWQFFCYLHFLELALFFPFFSQQELPRLKNSKIKKYWLGGHGLIQLFKPKI